MQARLFFSVLEGLLEIMVSPVLRRRKALLLLCGIFLGRGQVRPVPSALPLLMDLILVSPLKFYIPNLSDIENNQPQFYSDFISASRKLFASGSKQYFITGAPQ